MLIAEDHATRLGRDLNDEVCQRLAGVEYLIAAALPALGETRGDTLREGQKELQQVRRDTALLASWLQTATSDAVANPPRL